MHPLQGTPNNAQPEAPGSTERHQPAIGQIFLWTISAVAAVYIIRKAMSSDETGTKLYTLHRTVGFWQAVAAKSGQWAINAEQSYNDLVEKLH